MSEPTDESSTNDETEMDEDEALEMLVRYGLSAFLLLLLAIALLFSLQSLPETIITPNVTINGSNTSLNDTRVNFIAINATVQEVNTTNGNVTLADDDGNTTKAPLIGSRFLTDPSVDYPDSTNETCLSRQQSEAQSFIDTETNGSTYIALAYVNDTRTVGFHLFNSETEKSFNGRLLKNGYALPSNVTTPALQQTVQNATATDAGVWSCVPDEDESRLIPSDETAIESNETV